MPTSLHALRSFPWALVLLPVLFGCKSDDQQDKASASGKDFVKGPLDALIKAWGNPDEVNSGGLYSLTVSAEDPEGYEVVLIYKARRKEVYVSKKAKIYAILDFRGPTGPRKPEGGVKIDPGPNPFEGKPEAK